MRDTLPESLEPVGVKKTERFYFLPARYNDASQLTLNVQPGENRKDFAVTTK